MVFEGFREEALAFLQEIRENNTKEWFEANRSRYEKCILEPSRAYVEEMGEHLIALVPTINAIPKINGSLFRIYRDIRFCKDKTPIKSKIGVIFWQGGGKRMQSSSFYMHFDPETLFFAAGIRGFNDETLKRYRSYIKEERHRQNLYEVMTKLSQKGYKFPNPNYKRLPMGFNKTMRHAQLAQYANMYVYKEIPHPKAFFSAKFCNYAYKLYEEMLPMQQWVYEMTLYDEVDEW